MTRVRANPAPAIAIDQALCPMFVVDSSGVIRRVNRRAAEILGRPKSDLRGQNLTQVLRLPHGESLPLGAGSSGAISQAGPTRAKLVTLSGDFLNVELSVQPLKVLAKDRYLIVARESGGDCGVAVKTATYLRDIAEAQERERERIARELHDEALQSLLVAGIEMERLMQSAKADNALPVESLLNLRCLLRQVENDVRQISGRMRPDTVPQCGLLDAVGNAVQTLQERGIDAELRFRGAPVPVDPNIQILAYRIVQEALLNAWRHSGAQRVRTTVTCRDGRLTIRVTDNGSGFVLPAVLAAQGATEFLGIRGMYERASLMNATLRILSRASEGTCVSLVIPIVPPV